MIFNTVAYCRCSTVSQTEGDSYKRQTELINDYSSKNNFKIEKVFYDAISGTKEIRPEWDSMIQYLKLNPSIKTVLIERTDRLSRDLIVSEILIKELIKIDVTIVSVTEGDLMGDPSKKLIRQILSCVADFDRVRLLSKMSQAKDRIRKEKGKCEGRPLYNDLVGVTRIKELRSTGYSYNKIAYILNSEGIHPQKSTTWYPSSVREIALRHP